tara:strand:+ start:170 stop:664 length:495 start_codon:yes stop_codon:yes gene_type:complete
MKKILGIILIVISGQLTGQSIVGNYRDYFGNELYLKPDSTFKHTWRFDLTSSWTSGKWFLNNDTLFLKKVLVYDTLVLDETSPKLDSLVLSPDEVSGIITILEYDLSEGSSGGQNRQPIPEKLYFKNEKLYSIDKDGKLITKNLKGFWTDKKYPPFYSKPKLKK